MAKPKAISLILRTFTVAAVVAAGALLLRLPHQVANESSAAAPVVQQAAPVKIDLGKGFSASANGNATVITTPCPSGSLVRNRFPWAPFDLHSEFSIAVGAISSSSYRFETPSADVVSKVYQFGCSSSASTSPTSDQLATGCLALTKQENAVKPNPVACPIDTWTAGEGLTRPELQLATVVGAANIVDGVGGTMGTGGCDFGDRVTLSLDGQTVIVANTPPQGHDGFSSFVLPLLQSGTHTVRTTCTYSTADKPAVAQQGACISVVVTDGTITSLKECPGGSSAFRLSTNTTLEGACGGYGFVAQTTSATGVAQSLVATVKANQGDQATIAAPVIDPVGYFVVNCFKDFAESQGPLQCYHVAKALDVSADPNRVELLSVECPFTKVRSIDTL